MNKLNQKNKLISIVIPTFNSERTIINSINSILLQKLENQIEIIVVDDHSSDKTINLLKKIKLKKNFKLKIFLNKINKGSGFCRKIGIDMSSGYYIAFLDADDYWLENKLIKQINYLESNPNINFTYSDYYREIFYRNKLFFYKELTPVMVDIKKNKFINHIPNSSVLLTSFLAKKVSYPSLRVRNDFLYWNKLLTLNKKIKAYNFDPGNPYFVYGSDLGISSNKIKLVFNQWYLYRKYFRYSFIESVYGISLNIIMFMFKKIIFKKLFKTSEV
jgi:glycosyltransferase involved in cell wall biosynthesis